MQLSPCITTSPLPGGFHKPIEQGPGRLEKEYDLIYDVCHLIYPIIKRLSGLIC